MGKKLVSIRIDEEDLSCLEEVVFFLGGSRYSITRSMVIGMLISYSIEQFSYKMWRLICCGKFDKINTIVNDEENSRPERHQKQ